MVPLATTLRMTDQASCVCIGVRLSEHDLCCAVVQSEASGRSLVAATKFKAGSVVIVEQPFVSVLSKSLRDKARRPRIPASQTVSMTSVHH